MDDDRRTRILRAARAMLAEDPRSALPVRAVAERAGVGPSTLRHHFPSQRALHEAVFASAFERTVSDLRIRDASVPARERLRECLLQLLPPVSPGDAPVEAWVETIASVFGTGTPEEARTAWAAAVVGTRQQLERWLRLLTEEGAVAAGSEGRGARFLLTVLDGLALERVVPASRLDGAEEHGVLDDAITVVLRSSP